MSITLAQMRSRIQNKLNNIGSGAIFTDAEIDDNIRAGVRHIAYFGEVNLIQSSLNKTDSLTITGDTSTINGGSITKPTDYFRFLFGRAGGRRCRLKTLEEIDDFFYNTSIQPGNKNKYIVEYDGTYFKVYGDGSEGTVEFHYIGTISGTLLSSDSSTSPLTDNGTDYAIDWAFALCLESKGFNTQLANSVFSRVHNIITNVPFRISTGGPANPMGGVGK
jgi:hypothetical protein